MAPILDFLTQRGQELLLALYAVTVVMSVVVVILDKRDPTKALMWILVLVLLPGFGLLFYLFLGRNPRRRRAYGRKQLTIMLDDSASVHPFPAPPAAPDSIGRIQTPAGEVRNHWHIARLLLSSNSSPVLQGNATALFQNGAMAFAALLGDLREAREFIDMQFYIFREDRIGDEIARVLKRRAQEGIRVRLIYDDVGSWQLSARFQRDLRASGIDVRPFHRVAIPWLATRLNYRNHRKIVVIDGLHGHMGG